MKEGTEATVKAEPIPVGTDEATNSVSMRRELGGCYTVNAIRPTLIPEGKGKVEVEGVGTFYFTCKHWSREGVEERAYINYSVRTQRGYSKSQRGFKFEKLYFVDQEVQKYGYYLFAQGLEIELAKALVEFLKSIW